VVGGWCVCDSCVFDGYVQYVCMLLWLLSWEVVLLLLVGPPRPLGWTKGKG